MSAYNFDIGVFQAASERGIERASWMLSLFYATGSWIAPSRELSLKYLNIAREQGSLHAERDIAFRTLNGKNTSQKAEAAYETLAALAQQGFDLTNIGEKLLFSEIPEYVKAGAAAVELDSYQDNNWKARFLSSSYHALKGNFPASYSNLSSVLEHLMLAGKNHHAEHAFLMGRVMQLVEGHSESIDNLISRLQDSAFAKGPLDAWEIIMLPLFKDARKRLECEILTSLERHALTGDQRAELGLLWAFFYKSEGHERSEWAGRIVEILKKHPQLYNYNRDASLQRALNFENENDDRLLNLAIEIERTQTTPYIHRSFAIELAVHSRFEESEKQMWKSVQLGLPEATRLVAQSTAKKYHSTGLQFEDARFWAEIYTYENMIHGLEIIYNLNAMRFDRKELTDADCHLMKNVLELLLSQNRAVAKRELGVILIEGLGPIPPDRTRGLELLRSADRSDPHVLREIARLHSEGKCFTANPALAEQFLKIKPFDCLDDDFEEFL